MRFVLQKPGTGELAAEIRNAADNAEQGGGVFAFASKDGINTFLGSEQMMQMLQNGRPFRLIVGIDAITNASALLCIHDWLERFPETLTVEIFYHQNNRSIFHPKFCWFESGNNLLLITGSGNLTSRGLGQNGNVQLSGNWEAFTVQSLTGQTRTNALSEINNWLAEQQAANRLRSHEDQEVRIKAMANSRIRFTSNNENYIEATVHTDEPENNQQEHSGASVAGYSHDVLIREIPLNRRGQADLGQRALTEFFGYSGRAKNIFIQNVSLNNAVGPAEVIRLFVNSSRNYRLELHAISELEYVTGDDGSRMVVIAVKLDKQSFRYTIVPVTNEHYNTISAILGPISSSSSRRMRELYVTSQQLQDNWPGIPPNLLPVNQYTIEH